MTLKKKFISFMNSIEIELSEMIKKVLDTVFKISKVLYNTSVSEN